MKLLFSVVLSFLMLICPVVMHANATSPRSILPFRIAGNLYYVGNYYAASYLVVTPQGNILINSNYQSDVPAIKKSIEKLGFKFSDTKILLISHAHADHGGGSALIKKMTGARYMVMDADVPVVESGGKLDFQYGNSKDPSNFYQSAKVDDILHDGDKVKLGGSILVAHRTGGHTKGCTTWTMQVFENGRRYDVVMIGGPYVNPGYQFVNNVEYPDIASDYKHTFAVLKSLHCDIFLGAHGMYFDLEHKYALMQNNKHAVFVDPEGYKKFVVQREHDFNQALDKQKGIH